MTTFDAATPTVAPFLVPSDVMVRISSSVRCTVGTGSTVPTSRSIATLSANPRSRRLASLSTTLPNFSDTLKPTVSGIFSAHSDQHLNKSSSLVGLAEVNSSGKVGSLSSIPPDLELKARSEAEKAIKSKKIFTIIGPYPSLRDALRRRGWVEKYQTFSACSAYRTGSRYGSGRNEESGAGDDAGAYDEELTDSKENIERTSQCEKDDLYAVMSTVARNCTPTLVFAVKAIDVARHATRSGKIVNHFARSSNFTTKAGLCQNLRSVPWYILSDPDSFYPRCYNLSNPDDKETFFDDYKLTACCGFIKHFLVKFGVDILSVDLGFNLGINGVLSSKLTKIEPHRKYGTKTSTYFAGLTTRMALDGVMPQEQVEEEEEGEAKGEGAGNGKAEVKKVEDTSNNDDVPQSSVASAAVANGDSGTATKYTNKCVQKGGASDERARRVSCSSNTITFDSTADESASKGSFSSRPLRRISSSGEVTRPDSKSKSSSKTTSTPGLVPGRALRIAVHFCRAYLTFREHDDLDVAQEKLELQDCEWIQFFNWHYQFVHDKASMEDVSTAFITICRDILLLLRRRCPQLDLDGCRNIWILKPGAKSRGRGICCLDRYEDILTTIQTSDCGLVAQKYIERPFLIYKSKFDIRQWFLVTDWNPLTFWWYSDCYLRFCSQEYSLDDLNVAVHLSNNSVQKYFTPSPTRSPFLPEDNMWTSEEFEDYLRLHGYGRIWSNEIIPGMKHAILCSLLSSQEHMECRKSAFELYGADFMLSEDLQPWLIEINSSPSMARTTRATAILVDNVLEDLLKVVLDRKEDKQCDTGKFELAYKQQAAYDLPSTTNPNLTVQGKKIRKSRIVK